MRQKWSVSIALSDRVLSAVDAVAIGAKRSRSYVAEELLREALAARGVTIEPQQAEVGGSR